MAALKTLAKETGELPKSRIGCAANARQLVNELKRQESTRSSRKTKIQGMFDGNPPWVSQKLRDAGQGHRANFNLREAEGALDTAKTPYYDLVREVPRFANIVLYCDKMPDIDPELLAEWGEIESEEYHEILDQWEGFDWTIQLHQWEMCAYGPGPIFWPDEFDWRSEAIKSSRVLVPPKTKANVEQLHILAILHTMRSDQLWKAAVKNPKTAKSAGWDTDIAEKAIVSAGESEWASDVGDPGSAWEYYQQSIRNGDIFHGMSRSEDVHLASIFIKEFDGKISHYMISDSGEGEEQSKSKKKISPATLEDEGKETGYLFVRKNRFDSFSQIIDPFFFDTGPDGTWHSIKGLGPKIYDFCDVSNRVTCQALDGVVIGSGIVMEAQDANALQETQIALFGGSAVIAPGNKVVQTRIAESINGVISMKRELQMTLQSNTGSYRQRVSGENAEPTLGQAQLNAQQQGMLQKGAVNRYYTALDKFHYETLRRLLNPKLKENMPGGKEAKQFRDRCIARGVPEEMLDFDYVRRVKSMRSIGYGSPQIRDIATKELVSMIPMMDEQSRNNALRARAAAIPGVGQAMVDLYFPLLSKTGFPDDHAAYATTENNALRELGGETMVTARQNHPTHFQVHYADAMEHLKGLQTGQVQNPVEVLIHLENVGPHLQEHLQRIEGDPTRKDQVKAMTDAWLALTKINDQLRSAVEKWAAEQQGAEQPAEEPKPDADLMAKMAKVQGELKIKAVKVAGEMAIKEQVAKRKSRLADLQVAANVRRQNLTAAQPAPVSAAA